MTIYLVLQNEIVIDATTHQDEAWEFYHDVVNRGFKNIWVQEWYNHQARQIFQ